MVFDEYLPETVKEWAGLEPMDLMLTVSADIAETQPENLPLSVLNDDAQLDFETLANLIEAQL